MAEKCYNVDILKTDLSIKMKYKQPKKDANGAIQEKMSEYQPSDSAKQITRQVIMDYEKGYANWNKPLNEYNGRSVIEEINANQKAFNSYVPPKSEDPDESWRAQTIRPIVRNKLISIAAHITAQIIYPAVFAQNREDAEDRDAAQIMEDIVEWIINTSNYSKAFVVGVISALTDPATVLKQGYQEVIRKVKRMKEDGNYTMEEMLDEAMSGFFTEVVPLSEFYIANLYEENLQKQRFVMRQRYIDYYAAKSLYGEHENFKHVKEGSYAFFDGATNTFYDVKDENNKGLVHEVTYYNKMDDLELTFVNGILMCDSDYPMQRYDKLYPFSMTGYEPINNGKFALFKSAANKLGPDEDLINTLYNMVMDGTFLSLMPPMALYGTETLTSSVMVPGSITSLRPESKFENIGPKSDLRAGLLAIEETEKSISESSQDNMRAGLVQGGERTAFEIQKLDENAQKVLGIFGKYITFLVYDLGTLMVGDILQYLTLPEIKSLTSITDPLKYKTLLIPNKIKNGKKITQKIQFTDEYEGSKKKKGDVELEILEEEGGLDSDQKIIRINPRIFREIKYKIIISPDKVVNRSKALERALNLELYDRAIANPFVNHKALTQDMLFETYKPGQSAKYMQTEQQLPESMPTKPATPVNGNMIGQMTGSNSLKNALSLGE